MDVEVPSLRYDGIIEDYSRHEYGAIEVSKNNDLEKELKDRGKLMIVLNDMMSALQRHVREKRLRRVDGITVVGILNSGSLLYHH